MSKNTAARTSVNTAMLIAGTLIRMVASFVFVLYAADVLGLVGFGQYSLVIHYFELFLSLSATAAAIILTRDIARWRRNFDSLATTSLLFVTALAIGGAAAMLTMCWLFGFSEEATGLLMIAAIALIPASIGVILEAMFVALERAEFVTLGTAIETGLRLAFSFAALALGYGLTGVIWVLLISRCAMALVYWVSLKRIANPQLVFRWRHIRRFALRWRVFAAENWMATIYTNLDVIVLSALGGVTVEAREMAVGLYCAAWKVVRLGSVAAKSYTTAVFPVLSRMYVQSRESFAQMGADTVRFMCVIALPAVIFVTILSDRIIGLLYRDEYLGAVPVLQVLIWVLLLEFLNPFLSHTLFAQGKQRHSMNVAAIALVVNTIATLALVWNFGAVGAAIGTVIGGLAATCCYLFYTMNRNELTTCLDGAVRVFAASLGLGLVLLIARDASWLLLLVLSCVVYGSLLWAVKAVHGGDVQRFKSAFSARVS